MIEEPAIRKSVTYPKIFELESFAGTMTRPSIGCDTQAIPTIPQEIDRLFSKEPDWSLALDGAEEPLKKAWQHLPQMSVQEISKYDRSASFTEYNRDKYSFGKSIRYPHLDLVVTEGIRLNELKYTTGSLAMKSFQGFMRKFFNNDNELALYEGQCIDGVQNGYGRLITKNEVYIGDFVHGYKQGSGMTMDLDGQNVKRAEYYRDVVVKREPSRSKSRGTTATVKSYQ